MVKVRCEEIAVQLIVRTYDEHGRPVREQVGQAVKVFRATTPDVWATVDKLLAEANAPQTPAKPTPAPPSVREGKRR
jgi:hypothetical protein